MKFVKRNLQTKFNNKLIAHISSMFNISEDIVKIIISKGYTTKKDIVNFLQPQNFKYYNPFLLKGMEQAVKIINDAVKLNKKITVLGDYDTDGICATAILFKYFESVNVNINYFLPNRFVDGYGLTCDTVDKIISQYNPDLIITVDCGISSHKEVEYAKSQGVEVIVTDHHEIPEIVPNCVVINPKQSDQAYPFSELCGAGVALKLVQALAGYKFASTLTSIASFATVADIVPLINENRAIVYHGLKTYKENLPIGVIKLIDSLKITNLQTSDISLRVAPKINTAGRMGDANVAFRLFVENDEKKIAKQIKDLSDLNETRVSDGAEIFDETMKMLENENISNLKAIVLYKDEWNGGVLGIVCAKLVEKFNRPVCLLSKVENEYKGSVRSIEKIDIYKELSDLSDILIRFGGHSQAGGLSVTRENLEEFKIRLNKNLSEHYSDDVFEQSKYYDVDLNKVELNAEFLKQLSYLEPFGFGNEKPLFKFTINNAKISKMKNHPQHLRIKHNNLDMIAWNSGSFIEHLKTNSTKEFLIELNGENKFNNVVFINAIIKSFKINKLNTNVKQEMINANVIMQLSHLTDEDKNAVSFSENDNKTIIKTINNLDELVVSTFAKSMFGNIAVTNSFENYSKFVSKFSNYISNYEMFNVNNRTGENAILFLPNNNLTLTDYNNIIFLEELLTEKYAENLTEKNIFAVETTNVETMKCFKNISSDRNVFAIYHNSILNSVNSNIVGENIFDYYLKLSKVNPQFKNLKFDQFVFVVLVLQELEIVNIYNNETDSYFIKINKNIKSNLENSKIYNFVKFVDTIIK